VVRKEWEKKLVVWEEVSSDLSWFSELEMRRVVVAEMVLEQAATRLVALNLLWQRSWLKEVSQLV